MAAWRDRAAGTSRRRTAVRLLAVGGSHLAGARTSPACPLLAARGQPAGRGRPLVARRAAVGYLPAAGRRGGRRAARVELDARPVAALAISGGASRPLRRRSGSRGDGLAVHRPHGAVSLVLAAAAHPDRRLSRPDVAASDSRQSGPGARGRLECRAARPGTLLPRRRRPRRPVRRALHHRRADHRDLLPAVLPGHHAQAGQRRVPAHRGGRPAARLPGLPALPARRGARLAGVEHPRRPGRPGHAPDHRRAGRARRGARARRARSATPSATSTGCSPRSSAPDRSRWPGRTARTPPGC